MQFTVSFSPHEPKIPFGPQVPPSPFNTVFSVCVVPFRHRSLAKRNGAFAVRYCLHLRVTRSFVNALHLRTSLFVVDNCIVGLPVCRQSLRSRNTE